MNRLSRALAGYGRLAEKYGHPIALKTFVLQRLRWNRPIRVTLFGERIAVRMGSPDLEVAKSSLGGEFAPLEGLLPKTYSGLIVDAGGYIGTAAIKLARFYPMARI
ncbi:MAG: hypothetical protein Q7U20_00505, partial [Caulobacter sp.]|nr:hypothetical protein [Caulobacter sp.]